MNIGVVYQFKPHNKINGTLFYCFEYFKFIQKFHDVKFYVVGISDHDLNLVNQILGEKYNVDTVDITPIKLVQLYSLNLDRTLVLDVDTFYNCKEFFTGDVHCFSNDTHPMFRYKTNRNVTYYGAYPYQRYDQEGYLKFNFDIFKPLTKQGHGVFVSALNQKHLRDNLHLLKQRFNRPLILKASTGGMGDLFDHIDAVHYIHTQRDTNNRIIPEAFFYNKEVTIDDLHPEVDSISIRYNDIKQNGVEKYRLTEDDPMVQACLK
jgi:hypothetical protein